MSIKLFLQFLGLVAIGIFIWKPPLAVCVGTGAFTDVDPNCKTALSMADAGVGAEIYFDAIREQRKVSQAFAAIGWAAKQAQAASIPGDNCPGPSHLIDGACQWKDDLDWTPDSPCPTGWVYDKN